MPEDRKNLRIGYLTGHYPAVSHTFILREVEALRELGRQVVTYSIRRPPPSHLAGHAEAKAAAETFYVLEAAKRLSPLVAAQGLFFRNPKTYLAALALAWRMRAPGLRALIYQFFYFLEATIIASDMRKRGVTHLHNHFADGSANVAVLAARLAGAKFSYTLHGPAELYAPERWHLHEKTRQAAFVACISHFARSQAMYFSAPSDWLKLKIIHCGVVPELYARSEISEAPDEISTSTKTRLIYVGRLTAIKGVRILMEALEKALIDAPDLHLTLVGDGDDRSELEKIAAPFGDRVRFTGYLSQPDVAAELSKADVLVLPSFAEGLPVVLMEALASGIPVICTQVAGVSELVDNGINGIIVAPGDMDGLADQLVSTSKDADARMRMGTAGQERVRTEFDVRKEASRLADLFDGKLAGPPRPDLPENEVFDSCVG